MKNKTVMIIAGEPSGDLFGAGVVRELKKRSPEINILGIGGDKMQQEGMELIYHVRELAVMGFFEVLRYIPLLKSVKHTLNAILKNRRPDVLLLIDYPGFNLRFAYYARTFGIKILYYISPQVWAWNPGRLKKMRGVIDKMLVVFSFEEEIYRKNGIDVEFVGHPLLELLNEPQDRELFCKRHNLTTDKPIFGLFPGSRQQELERIFPTMIGTARILYQQLGVQVVVGVASTLDFNYVRSFIRNDFPIYLIQDSIHDVIGNTDVALVTSGTATLELACYRIPMIIVYKTSLISYIIARMLVQVKNIGLVNIVAGEQIVPEYIQWKVKADLLVNEAKKFLTDVELRKKIAEKLSNVRQMLGTSTASKRVADNIMKFLEKAL